MYHHDGVCTWGFFLGEDMLKDRSGFCYKTRITVFVEGKVVIFIVRVGICSGGDYSGCGGVSVSGWWLCC